jgi:hypothetical protein
VRYPEKRPLPAPLPPERRTVGQLIAEAIKLYQSHLRWAFCLGAASVLVDVATYAVTHGRGPTAREQLAVLVVAGTPLYSAAFVGASRLVVGSVPRGRLLRAYALALLVFLPFPFLIPFVVLPALAWLALFGLSVPALLAEDLSALAALRRGVALARADYVHVLGGICGLVVVFFVVRFALSAVLHTQAGNAALSAAALADLVLTPFVFMGSALLYVDQEARFRIRYAKAPVTA